jgi:uncharacterized protein YbjT (DUF2867 family)
MKIVVIGGSGLVGANVVARLRNKWHDVVAASPRTGVNAITGEGLADTLAGAQAVVDVANAPDFEDRAVMEYFETSGRTLLAAEAAAGVRHHIALSVVGAERLPQSGYLRAKVAQEKLIKDSRIRYTILRATQFFEFADGIAQSATEGQAVRLPTALIQPVAADDVAALLARIAGVAALNLTIELAGPEKMAMDDFVRWFLRARRDPRQVIGDPRARYFGAKLTDRSLTPRRNAHVGSIRFDDWLNRAAMAAEPTVERPGRAA